jgi:hypothetical protein
VEHLNISNNVIVSTGTQTRAGDLRGINCDEPVVGSRVKYVSIKDNIINGFDAEGIFFKGNATDRNVDWIEVVGNKIYNSGVQSPLSLKAAIFISTVDNFIVKDNIAIDDQLIKSQSYGLWVQLCQGNAQITGNDFSNGAAVSQFGLNDMGSMGNVYVKDNVDFAPYSGKKAITGTVSWTQQSTSGTWKRNTAVTETFGIPLPQAPTKASICCTLNQIGWIANVTSVTSTGFTAEILSTIGDPGSSATGTLHWQVEV